MNSPNVQQPQTSHRHSDDSGPGNGSGLGRASVLPDGILGWSWGAFIWGWVWGIANRTWIGLLTLIPYVGLLVAVYLGIKGRELAWRNKRWESVEHFSRVQRSWSIWGFVFVAVIVLLVVLVAMFSPPLPLPR